MKPRAARERARSRAGSLRRRGAALTPALSQRGGGGEGGGEGGAEEGPGSSRGRLGGGGGRCRCSRGRGRWSACLKRWLRLGLRDSCLSWPTSSRYRCTAADLQRYREL